MDESVFDNEHLPIQIRGARVHNLKSINLDIPRNRLTVISGPSGSGKSSLAFDTVYAEGQRQYIESLSVYSRQFLHQLERPDVDSIKGLQPTISIDQGGAAPNPRSTVATVTEIYDFLRLLYSRIGTAHCYKCGRAIRQQTPEQVLDELMALPEGVRLMILAPVVRGRKGRHKDIFRRIVKTGFVRARIDGAFVELDPIPELDPQVWHNVEVIIDRLVLRDNIRPRLLESLKLAIKLGEGLLTCIYEKDRQVTSEGTTRSVWKEILFSTLYSCPKCKINYLELEPRTFSFNSPYGICQACHGAGKVDGFDVSAIVPDWSIALKDNPVPVIKELSVATRKRWDDQLDRFRTLSGVQDDLPLDKWDKETLEIFFYGKKEEPNSDESTDENNDSDEEKDLNVKQETDNGIEQSDTVSTNSVLQKSLPAVQKKKIGKNLEVSDKKSRKSEKKTDKKSGKTSSDSKNAVTGSIEKGTLTKGSDISVSTGTKYSGLLPFLSEIFFMTRTKKEKQSLSVYRDRIRCRSCEGSRIRPESRSVTIQSKRIHDVTAMTMDEALAWFHKLELPPEQAAIAGPLLTQIVERIEFMNRVGLNYLTLDRASDTLSGGELQRVRLASGLGSGLVGICYILDEPSTGLHPRDNSRLIEAMRNLQYRGNTVLVVEHDEAIISQADWLVDIGPGAGRNGGEILAEGTPLQVAGNANSITGRYLSGQESIAIPKKRRRVNRTKTIQIDGVTTNNLKDVSVTFPLGTFICVTGVSGSGKSSLLNETLVPAIAYRLYGAQRRPGSFKSLRGVSRIDKLIQIDQTPIGRSPRSNPATYTGLFDEIRKVFATSKDARRHGFKAGRFSFNVAGGRCEECQGQGLRKIEMHFLPDMYALCPVCEGRRFNRQTLEVKYKDKSIADVLDMTVEEAYGFFENYPVILRMLESLRKVGLGYLTLGQSSTTLSGGEAQRIKLATELARVETGNTLYVLDEPTCGLHVNDIRLLLGVLSELVDLGNTVIVIEHNLDVIKIADWIIDLGPEGGTAGGYVTACGTPEKIAALADNHTGRFLKEALEKGKK